MAVKPLKMLNERHHLFIAYYLEDFNAARAARRARFSDKTAHVMGHQLLKDPLVSAELKRQRDALLEQVHVDLGVIVREHVRVAFSDISHLMSWDDDGVHLIPSEALTPHETAAIQDLTISKRTIESESATTTVVTARVKLHSKLNALDALSRLLPGLNRTAGDDGEAGAGNGNGKGLASLLEAAQALVHTARGDI